MEIVVENRRKIKTVEEHCVRGFENNQSIVNFSKISRNKHKGTVKISNKMCTEGQTFATNEDKREQI